MEDRPGRPPVRQGIGGTEVADRHRDQSRPVSPQLERIHGLPGAGHNDVRAFDRYREIVGRQRIAAA